MPPFLLVFKALRQLGLQPLSLYARYQIGLRSGYYRWLTSEQRLVKDGRAVAPAFRFQPLLRLPAKDKLLPVLGKEGLERLLAEAGEILAGKARLFGGEPLTLQLTIPGKPGHWTTYQQADAGDIKLVWEPARFGWAYTLGRAYYLTGDERYPAAFWNYAETFLAANPPFRGPHWVSAQEVALRLIAFAFALQIFAPSEHTTPGRASRLAQAIADHAARIPPTLVYARAQNNNHLLSEAAGLLTAGLALPEHPQAPRWREMGWRWFNHGLQTQIAVDGAYTQHSANYQRLMLQLALWVNALIKGNNYLLSLRAPFAKQSHFARSDTHSHLFPGNSFQDGYPALTCQRLSAATCWLLALLDPESGRLPNLGPNDGAYILPLTICPFEDYRPVLQAAAAAFLDERPFEDGVWDEMVLWTGTSEEVHMEEVHNEKEQSEETPPYALCTTPPHTLRNPSHRSWAYLRLAHFTSRPGHADQLHLDLWWRGFNIAQDAGTYLYNAPPPWDNALMSAHVHNTLTVNDRDQMTRLGRFLYLDWAQAELVSYEQAEDGTWQRLTAQHNGYRSLGVTHQRRLTSFQDGQWTIEDLLIPNPSQPVTSYSLLVTSLHWLLPDWPWEIEGPASTLPLALHLQSPLGRISLLITSSAASQSPLAPLPCPPPPLSVSFQLSRSGALLAGSGPVSPTWGWVSPTYGVKVPALSLRVSQQGALPLAFTSQFHFPEQA